MEGEENWLLGAALIGSTSSGGEAKLKVGNQEISLRKLNVHTSVTWLAV